MEFERKLASIMVIDELIEIPGADKIELARLEGWQAVVRKGEYQVGDKVVYIETDALLPEVPEFEFMQPRKYRVKQIKLRGTISNGLVFKLEELYSFKLKREYNVGTDLTATLGIEHYQKKAEEQAVKSPTFRKQGFKGFFYGRIIKLIELLIGPINAMGRWPGACPKSDEPRIDHIYNTIKRKYVGTPAVVHEKMHGKSLTVYYNAGKTGVCSRNYELLSESTRPTTPFKRNLGGKIAKFFGIKIVSQDQEDYWVYTKSAQLIEKLTHYCTEHSVNLAIQLELCGPGINGNMYGFTELRGFLFNIWDIDGKRYFNTTETEEFCLSLNITRVPFLANIVLHDDMQAYVKACSTNSTMGKCVMEGHVIRPNIEVKDPCVGRLSFKVINPAYKDKEDKLLGLA